MSYNLWVYDEKNFVNRVKGVEAHEMWDKINVLFWDENSTTDLLSFVNLIVAFKKAGVKSQSGWKWLLDGMLDDYLQQIQRGTFLLVSWEELIDSKVSGIKTHPLFEVLKRVRKQK